MSDIKSYFNLKKIYVYVSKREDILKLSDTKIDDTNFIPFILKSDIYSKNELADIIRLFHIRRVYLNNEPVPVKEIFTARPESYERAVKGFHRIYVKKIVFLLKRTINLTYVRLLEKQQFIVLVRPDKEENTKLDFLHFENTKVVPVFSDSTEIEAFLSNSKVESIPEVKEYAPMLLRFSELLFFMKNMYKDFSVMLDPYGLTVKGVNFTLKLSQDFMSYVHKTRIKHRIKKKQ